MSQKEKALEFLTEIQKCYIDNGGTTPLGFRYSKFYEVYNEAVLITITEFFEKEKGYSTFDLDSHRDFIESLNSDFTIFEIQPHIFLLGHIKNDIKEFFSHMHEYGFFEPSKLYFPEDVVIGTAQFGEINAMAIASPNSDKSKIILFDSGIFIFINSFAKIVSILLPKETVNDDFVSYNINKIEIDQSIQQNGFVNGLFTSLIINYLTKGHAGFSQKFFVDKVDNKLTDALRNTAELFIISHEYGHILFNHLDFNRKVKKELAKRLQIETWEIDWDQEFQADEFASIVVIRLNHVIKDMEASIAFAGVPFFFSTVEILYTCLDYQFSETHPSPEQRMKKLYDRLYLDTDDKELVDEIKEFGNAIQYIIKSLWSTNKSEIFTAINNFKLSNL
jgi:hypothetical protein